MPYEGDRIAEGFDRAAMRMTGRQVHTGKIGPKTTIVATLIFISLTAIGMYLTVQGAKVGQGIVFSAAMGSLAIKLFNDYKERGNGPLDERELAIYWKANAIGAMIPLIGVAVWSLFLGNLADFGMWYPREMFEWVTLSFFLLGLMTQIGLIVTAWLTPSYAADLDEND